MFVLDASVALAFLLVQEQAEIAQVVIELTREETAVAPSHWSLEIANILAREIRRETMDWDEAEALSAETESWSVQVDTETSAEALKRTLALAVREGLTAYDAAYLELCLRRDLPLATFDRQLASAARGKGVRLLLE